jgi:hypothetical protein
MIQVVTIRDTQPNAAIFPMVGCLPKEVITLGGYPPPASSHPPRPSPLHGTTGSLMEVLGQIGQAHHVLDHFGNFLISLVPRGA